MNLYSCKYSIREEKKKEKQCTQSFRSTTQNYIGGNKDYSNTMHILKAARSHKKKRGLG